MTPTRIKTLRPTYATVDLSRFAHNIKVIREVAGSDIIAIIKADGYGHGARETAQYAWQKCNVRNFGVATISEAITLRKSLGDDPRIIVLGYVDREYMMEAVENRIVMTVFDYESASELNSLMKSQGLIADINLKIDTGMHRLGFDTTLDYAAFRIKYPHLNVVHVMSHLSSSDSDKEYSLKQIEQFREFIASNRIAASSSMYNSSGIANFDNTFSYVRPGLILYGYLYGERQLDLKRVMSITSKIVHVKKVAKGEAISYNRRFVADRDMTIGVVPIGYADGYLRSFTNKAHMVIDGQKCPVVGTVCMDMTMIDISLLPESSYSHEVEVMGDNVDATQWAEWGNTISYEIICGISDRIPRLYQHGEE